MLNNLLFEDLSYDYEELIKQEIDRQKSNICLIASENLTSKAVMRAQGSCFTNKYAEGYPNKRYYEGCEICDIAESRCIEMCTKLFDVKHANVQPHSGSQANQAVYHALLKPGDTILGMDLAAGGHLTHGFKTNISGKNYNAVCYGVKKDTLTIDYDEVEELAKKHNPKIIIAGASSYSKEIDWAKFREIADSVGAIFLADISHLSGLIASKNIESPSRYAHIMTSTTHKTLRGPRGGVILTNSDDLIKKINSAVMPGVQGGPMMHTILAKAVCFEQALTQEFQEYGLQIIKNSQAMCDEFQKLGLKVVSDGTDNHMFMIDFSEGTHGQRIDGKTASKKLAEKNIVCNYNMVPFDTGSVLKPSGIRVGTPFVTSCGFDEEDCRMLARYMYDCLFDNETEEDIDDLFEKVENTVEAINDDL